MKLLSTMKRPIMLAFSLLISLAFVSGCKILLNPTEPIVHVSSTNTTTAVIIAVERSYAGDLVGANQDAYKMKEILSKVTDDIVIVNGDNATKKNVIAEMERACSNELAIIYFAAHGAQEKTKIDKENEADGKDEYIFLPNTTIDDNEIWSIVSKSTNRVFMIFDCCTSGTMFSASPSRSNESVQVSSPLFASPKVEMSNVNLLSWSACKDGYQAFGTSSGGFFTQGIYNAVIKAGLLDEDYSTIWTIIKCGSVSKYSSPQKNVIGKSFESNKVFR